MSSPALATRSPAPPPVGAQPRLAPLPVSSVPAPACESCQQRSATHALVWPDARFLVCRGCQPTSWSVSPIERTQVNVDPGGGSVDSRPASTDPRWAVVFHGPCELIGQPCELVDPGQARLVEAARTTSPHELAPPPPPPAVGEVLRAAACIVTTSRPARKGPRLTADGACDVVAALTLAVGGTVDETGRPAAPEERPAAQLLRQVLTRLASHLAAQAWDDDPVPLIDAWQASPDATGRSAATTLRALADAVPCRPVRQAGS